MSGSSAALPPTNTPLTDASGQITTPWKAYFISVGQALSTAAAGGAAGSAAQQSLAQLYPGSNSGLALESYILGLIKAAGLSTVGVWSGPGLPGNPSDIGGSNSFYNLSDHTLYEWNGTNFVTNLVANAVSGLTQPGQLNVPDPSNLVTNPNWSDGLGSPSASGWTGDALYPVDAISGTDPLVPAGAVSFDVGVMQGKTASFGQLFSVTAGETFFFSFWAATDTAGLSPAFGFMFTDINQALQVFVSGAGGTFNALGTWQLFSGQLTVPAAIGTGGAVPVGATIWLESGLTAEPGGPGGPVWFGPMTVRKAASAELLVPNSIAGGNLVNNTITNLQLALQSVEAGNVVNGTLTSAQMATNAGIVASQIDTITAPQITGLLAAAQIESLAASQVTGQLTAEQIAAVNAAAVAGQLTASQIATIDATQLTGQLVAGQIAAGTITSTEIAAQTITGTNIAGATITGNNIVGATITGGNIAGQTITGANIAGGTITGANIVGGTITGGNIAGQTITGGNIQANTIEASRLTIADTSNICLNPLMVPTQGTTTPDNWTTFDTGAGVGITALAATASGVPTGANASTVMMSTARNAIYGSEFSVQTGEAYYLSIDYAGAATNQVSAAILFYNAAGQQVGAPGTTPVTPSTTWATVAGQVTVPTGAATGEIYIIINGADNTALPAVYFTRCVVRKAASAELLVSGSIIGEYIAGNTITANNMAANSINTAALAVGSSANTIWNPSCQISTNGWPSPSATSGVTAPEVLSCTTAGWYDPVEGAGEISAQTMGATDFVDTFWHPFGNHTACIPGQWYEGQARICTHYTSGVVQLVFYDANGKQLSVLSGNTVTVPTTGVVGNFGLSYVIGQAPASAAYMDLAVQMNTPQGAGSGTPAYALMFCQALLGTTVAGATQPQSYAPGGATSIVGGMIRAASIEGTSIAAQTITGGNIAAGTITAAQIASGTITSNQLYSGTVQADLITASNIGANTITVNNLAAGTLSASHITAGTIDGAIVDFTDAFITNAYIQNLAVGTSNIQGSAVGEGQLAGGAVTNSAFAVGANGGTLQTASASVGVYVDSGTIYIFVQAQVYYESGNPNNVQITLDGGNVQTFIFSQDYTGQYFTCTFIYSSVGTGHHTVAAYANDGPLVAVMALVIKR